MLDNNAAVGIVVAVENVKVGKRMHPHLTLTVAETELTKDIEVWWRDNLKVKGVVTKVEPRKGGGAHLTIHITAGMQNNVMPEVGARAAFITLAPSFPIRPPMPTAAPWTHRARVEVVVDDE